jgi:hypothetical protein
MPRRPHENDIRIGEDRWIETGTLNLNDPRMADLDPWLNPLDSFLGLLETYCVAGCCGIDAFGFLPGEIRTAVARLSPNEVARLLAELFVLREAVAALDCETVSSRRLNQLFRKIVFLELVDHIRSVVAAE